MIDLVIKVEAVKKNILFLQYLLMVFRPAKALRHISLLYLRKLKFTLVSKNSICHFQLSEKVWPFFPYTESGHIVPIHSSPPDCVTVICCV